MGKGGFGLREEQLWVGLGVGITVMRGWGVDGEVGWIRGLEEEGAERRG